MSYFLKWRPLGPGGESLPHVAWSTLDVASTESEVAAHLSTTERDPRKEYAIFGPDGLRRLEGRP